MLIEEIKIRKFKREDISYLKKMIDALSRFHGDKTATKASFIEEAYFKFKNSFCYLVCHANKPVGFIIGYDWMNYTQNKRVHHVDLLYVDAKYRRDGIGALLMRHSCKMAMARGCSRVSVGASIENRTSNLFYLNLGFNQRVAHSNNYILQNEGLIDFVTSEPSLMQENGKGKGKKMMRRFGLLLGSMLGLLLASPVWAAAQNFGVTTETTAKQAVLLEAATGIVLLDKGADVRMPTSSMSKMLTIYLVFDAIKQGKLKLDEMVTISEHAWRQEGSRMFAQVGTQVKVEDLIRGVVIQSGNDASVALAEAVAGTESIFANRMNEMAAKLGMTNSHFVNATGLPDPQHYSTPHDLARLGVALHRDFPDYYHYFGEIEFTYNKIKQGNRNPLLYRNMGVDGIKTGHTETAGFGLTASAERKGRRLVLVVNGLTSMQERADEPARLMEWGYHEFNSYPLFKVGQSVAMAKVWLGEAEQVPVTVGEDFSLTLPVALRDKLKVAVEYQEPLPAPISKGQVIGKAIITVANNPAGEVSLVAGADVPKLGFFAALFTKLGAVLGGKHS